MAHHRYQTDGLVLGHYPVGEADSLIDIFTEDLGRVRAVARSIREEHSKLRFSLQNLSVARISLVRGKETWRIVGAESRENLYTALADDEGKRELILRMVRLLRKLLAGEESNPALFRVVMSGIESIRTTATDSKELTDLECLIVLRILHNLGYLAKDERTAPFLDVATIDSSIVSLVSPMRREMIRQINTSLQESQL
ncbi:MAG: DNA repair protein RecO [Candidatus Pacebacteria bacterium]|nr:DNA repair protein RecO [Candidatus Paceibacterota bacterium]